jgi:hypothetical protein
MPGAGHIVHMPAHIYYRVGQYRRSLDLNKRAVAVDETLLPGLALGPALQERLLPAQHPLRDGLGADGRRRRHRGRGGEEARRRSAAELATQFQIMEPVKAAPFTTQLAFADPDTVLACRARRALVLVRAMSHYARATALARKKDLAAARAEVAAIAALDDKADFKPYEPWGVPAKAIVETARLVADGGSPTRGRSLRPRAKAYEAAIALEDTLQLHRAALLVLPGAPVARRRAPAPGPPRRCRARLRASLARVRNNGWALAGLAEVYKRKGDAKGEAAARAPMPVPGSGRRPVRTWRGSELRRVPLAARSPRRFSRRRR